MKDLFTINNAVKYKLFEQKPLETTLTPPN